MLRVRTWRCSGNVCSMRGVVRMVNRKLTAPAPHKGHYKALNGHKKWDLPSPKVYRDQPDSFLS